jgi:FKBP-type peptidyl-prolyl cis-trans isomerase
LALALVLATIMGCLEPAEDKDASPEGMKDADGMVTTKSGLKYKDLKVGDGAMAKPGRTVEVHYTGWLKDGKKFQSSLDSGESFTFKLDAKPRRQVIEGWDKGIVGMKAGGKRKLIIPAELAYGKEGKLPVIPPDAELTFEVELLKVTQPRGER